VVLIKEMHKHYWEDREEVRRMKITGDSSLKMKVQEEIAITNLTRTITMGKKE